MICAVIKGPSYAEADSQLAQAEQVADLVEMRLDLFTALDIAAVRHLRQKHAIPMLFTLRSACQGGNYKGSEAQRLGDIAALAKLDPEYLDVEEHVPHDFCSELALRHPNIKLIISYHNFDKTPDDLDSIYLKMRQPVAWGYKMAVTADNVIDALRLISFAKGIHDRLIAISMGPDGQLSRILAPVINSPFTFAALQDDLQSAPGQLTAKLLRTRYHYHTLSPATSLYGLIGNPVDSSLGDIAHNAWFAEKHIDAVYVKMRVQQDELAPFLSYAKQLPFKGLSVTMPLKEAILPYLDGIEPAAKTIGAVNTLLWQNGQYIGFNTDGVGALNAIERILPVGSKRVVIVGAGGAARAIAHEAMQRGGSVTIVNRHVPRAKAVADSLGCERAMGLDQMHACAQAGYDLLVNGTPEELPIGADDVLPGAVVMDIKTRPAMTRLLQVAQGKGCTIIPGYDMFIEQALGQQAIWSSSTIGMT